MTLTWWNWHGRRAFHVEAKGMCKGPGVGVNSMFFCLFVCFFGGTTKSVRLRARGSWRLELGDSRGTVIQNRVQQAGTRSRGVPSHLI